MCIHLTSVSTNADEACIISLAQHINVHKQILLCIKQHVAPKAFKRTDGAIIYGHCSVLKYIHISSKHEA